MSPTGRPPKPDSSRLEASWHLDMVEHEACQCQDTSATMTPSSGRTKRESHTDFIEKKTMEKNLVADALDADLDMAGGDNSSSAYYQTCLACKEQADRCEESSIFHVTHTVLSRV